MRLTFYTTPFAGSKLNGALREANRCRGLSKSGLTVAGAFDDNLVAGIGRVVQGAVARDAVIKEHGKSST